MVERDPLTEEESDRHKEIIDNANLFAYGVIAPIIVAIGLMGNLATLVTLANRAKFSGRIYTYIRTLALSDLACLISSIICVSFGKIYVCQLYCRFSPIMKDLEFSFIKIISIINSY